MNKFKVNDVVKVNNNGGIVKVVRNVKGNGFFDDYTLYWVQFYDDIRPEWILEKYLVKVN